MSENENNVQNEQEQEFNPVEEIKAMKENMVDKEKYNKVLEERNKYFNSLLKGEGLTQSETKVEKVDVAALSAELFKGDLTNLEFAEKALKLREAVIEQEGRDIFVGSGAKFAPDRDDFVKAQAVAEAFEHCIEYANGDPASFTNELQRITIDANPIANINPKIKR